jgi:uncharacterized membrane protein YbaN (DUF454 family)
MGHHLEMKSYVRTGIGFTLLGLGAIGLVLPVWPTTPFVLASFACFSSSPKIRTQILQVPFFREYIENYEKGKGLSSKTIRVSLLWLWSMLAGSMLIINEMWMTILLTLIGAAVSLHILWIAKAKKEH